MTDAQILTSHLNLPMLVGMLYVCYLLRMLSQRMGAVTKMRAYYRWFDVGNVLIMAATINYVLTSSAVLAGKPLRYLAPSHALFAFHIPLALGIGINVLTALKYWGWLTKQP